MPSATAEFEVDIRPTWCPGCSDFSILNAVKHAMANLGIAPHEALVVTGIGCGSKLADYIHTNGYLTLHGRPLAVATGAKLANQTLHVMVVDGDGDAYGIGGNHFIHTVRRNPDITHIVENNQIYALTKGQYSPTTPHGAITTTSPEGAIERAVNPLLLALTMGATFVARGFAGDPKHLAGLLQAAIRHEGYALIDVLQPCLVYDKLISYDWYRQRVYKLDEAGHDEEDYDAAVQAAQKWGDRIPIGILYHRDGVPTYESQVQALRHGPLVHQPAQEPAHLDRLKERFL